MDAQPTLVPVNVVPHAEAPLVELPSPATRFGNAPAAPPTPSAIEIKIAGVVVRVEGEVDVIRLHAVLAAFADGAVTWCCGSTACACSSSASSGAGSSGSSSEKLDRQIEKMELKLKELQDDRAAEEASAADDTPAREKKKPARRPLPAHLSSAARIAKASSITSARRFRKCWIERDSET